MEQRVKRSSGSSCGDIWVDGDALFGGIAAAGAAFAYYIYTLITMARRKRKRRDQKGQMEGSFLVQKIHNLFMIGMRAMSH